MKMKEYLNQFLNVESVGFFDLSRIYRKLMVLHENHSLKKLMITSALAFEGKSTIAALLSITLSKFNHRDTVLIDADFRKPKIHHFFGLSQKMGLAEIILNQVDISECCKNTNFNNLKLITCGDVKNNSVGLIEIVRIKEIINKLSEQFANVIVDCPPVMLVGDATIFAQDMDGILLVIKAGKTQREVAKYAADLLQGVGGKIIGVILNDLGRNLPYYYNPYYYKYYNQK